MKAYKQPFKYKYVWNEEKKKYFQQFTTPEEQANMQAAKNLLKNARILYQKCYDHCAANRINLEQYFEENPSTAKDIQITALTAQKLVEGIIEYDIRKYMVAGPDVQLNEEED